MDTLDCLVLVKGGERLYLECWFLQGNIITPAVKYTQPLT